MYIFFYSHRKDTEYGRCGDLHSRSNSFELALSLSSHLLSLSSLSSHRLSSCWICSRKKQMKGISLPLSPPFTGSTGLS
ncbi:hypothetical protein BS78_08G091600 [Paspalum vaginatum]|nr:hypothetical protein BS78_08G091600 [Paspalum vaginatum]